MLKYGLGPEIRDYSVGCWPGEPIENRGIYSMLVDDIRKCVVFLGFKDETEIGGIRCIGTGFLFKYKDLTHLVTVKHIARELEGVPFYIRANLVRGGAKNIPADEVKWFYHHDNDVDLAVTPFTLIKAEYKALYLPEEIIKGVGEYNIGIGSICYTIGLYRLLYGKERNLPIVFTGNIAMVPEDEKIPVEDWDNPGKTKYIEGYLVGSPSLDGLSGSPVFARPSTDVNLPCLKSTEKDISGERLLITDVFLIGIWADTWNAPPDQVLASQIKMGGNIRASIGVGVVVPAAKLLELLEEPAMQKKREDFISQRDAKYAASPDSVKSTLSTENPQHKEDFNSLVSAAVKKKPPDD